jgi:hypothetical protein
LVLGIVVFEPQFYAKGGWSAQTMEVINNRDQQKTWLGSSLAAYKSRFDPVRLVERSGLFDWLDANDANPPT